jgi:quercetin dioxygenase-like cupin family protein
VRFAREVAVRENRLVPAMALALGATLAAMGSQLLMAQSTPIKRTILQQKDLEGAAGKEVVMYRAEIAPGGAVGRHSHPGPELIYVLEGALLLEHDGQPPVTLKAGESTHIPPKHIHDARNANTTHPVKAVVFLVGEKGQPLATPVK